MDLRSDDTSAKTVERGAGRRVLALFALGVMAATVLIAVLGLILHPLVIVWSSAAVALVVAGIVLLVTTPGIRRLLGGAAAVAGVIAWIWILVDGDAILFIVAIAVGTAVATPLALLA